jgi:hypothetical protein
MSFFISFDQCWFEVYFVRDKYCYSCLFLGANGLINLISAFHPKPVIFSVNEIVGSSFLIQFANQCLLMGELSPLTFSVSLIGMW